MIRRQLVQREPHAAAPVRGGELAHVRVRVRAGVEDARREPVHPADQERVALEHLVDRGRDGVSQRRAGREAVRRDREEELVLAPNRELHQRSDGRNPDRLLVDERPSFDPGQLRTVLIGRIGQVGVQLRLVEHELARVDAAALELRPGGRRQLVPVPASTRVALGCLADAGRPGGPHAEALAGAVAVAVVGLGRKRGVGQLGAPDERPVRLGRVTRGDAKLRDDAGAWADELLDGLFDRNGPLLL